MKFDYSIKNQLLRSIAIGSFILSIFAGNIFASSTELYWTLKENDVWEAKNLLDQGANLFEPVGPLGETPLDIAAPWTIRSLFTEERYKHYSHEALYWTVKHKTVPKAQQFLDLGADPNTSGPYGITPMQMASSQEMLEALLECGGNPHVALGTAIRHLYVDIVRQLVVERGIVPNATAIDLANQIKYFLANQRSYLRAEIPEKLRKIENIIEILNERRCDSSEINPNVELYHAILRDDVSKALQFLDLGAKPNEPVGPQGQTAMQMASSAKMIKALLQFGGDPNVALGTGIRQVSRSIVYISLARGADPNAPIGPQGQTARDWAHTPAKSFLFANFGGNSVALYYNAVLWQDVPEIQRLLALGANLNAPVGLEDETVMDLAHRQENPEILAALAPYEEV